MATETAETKKKQKKNRNNYFLHYKDINNVKKSTRCFEWAKQTDKLKSLLLLKRVALVFFYFFLETCFFYSGLGIICGCKRDIKNILVSCKEERSVEILFKSKHWISQICSLFFYWNGEIHFQTYYQGAQAEIYVEQPFCLDLFSRNKKKEAKNKLHRNEIPLPLD